MPPLWLALRLVGTVVVALATRPRVYHNRDGVVLVVRWRLPWRR